MSDCDQKKVSQFNGWTDRRINIRRRTTAKAHSKLNIVYYTFEKYDVDALHRKEVIIWVGNNCWKLRLYIV